MLRRCVHGIAQRGAAFNGAATRSASLATPILRTVVGAGERWLGMTVDPAVARPYRFVKKVGKGAPALDLEQQEAENEVEFKRLLDRVKNGTPQKKEGVIDQYVPALLPSPLLKHLLSFPAPSRTPLVRKGEARDGAVSGSRLCLVTAQTAPRWRQRRTLTVRVRRYLWSCHTKKDVRQAEILLRLYAPLRLTLSFTAGSHFIKVSSRGPPWSRFEGKSKVNLPQMPPLRGGICIEEVACVWQLTKETIHLPLGCLQGGCADAARGAHARPSETLSPIEYRGTSLIRNTPL